jgi:hypothetical protein
MTARRRRERAGHAPESAAPQAALPVHAILLVLLALAILFVPQLRSLAVDPDDRDDGYASIVAAAIAQGWLYPLPDQGDGGEVDGRVERARGPNIPAEFDSFIQASFLREDMSTLDPSIWRYDGNRLGVDPRAHLINGAYEGTSGWRGSILFADRQVQQQLLDERGTPAAWLIPSPRPGALARPRQINLNAPTDPADAQADLATDVSFVANVDGAATVVAVLRRIGDGAVLRVPRRDRATVRVSVGTADAAPGGAFQVGWRLLRSGDTLSFAWPGGARRFQFIQTEPAISRARGDAVRVRDASLDSFARPIESAVGSGTQSLETSINSRIQAVAQQLLAEQSMALYGSEGITSFRSAAVLMDGMSGEIVALPTFPVTVEQLHPSQRGSPVHRRMLERNSNFVRMVAGSSAKPPMATAILNAFPFLGDLRVTGTTPFRTLLGIDLGVPVPDHGGGVFDFHSFLAQSSNKYAAMLMLLALSDAQSIQNNVCDGPSNETFWIGAAARNCRPRSVFMEGARQGPQGMRPVRAGQPAGQGWSSQLYSLFCVSPNGPDERPAVPSPGCLPDDPARRSIWRGGLFERPRLLAAVSPDREGFGLNVVDSVYEDYVMTILGGNRGRWSTIGLAQAYSRILTGRATTARLTPRASDTNEEQPEQVRIPLDGNVQARVLDGLRAVVAEGTAVSLANAGFPHTMGNDELRLFAKTGTPNVAFLGDDERQMLQDFAGAGCGLRLVLRPRPNAPSRAELTVGDNAALPVVQAIAANENCRARFGPNARRLAELIQTLNRSPEALAAVRADATGRVTEIPPQVRLGEGTGHVFVLMVARYRPGTPDSQPCSVRTVAINFQARTAQNRLPAIGYAVSLLRNELVRNWFLGSPCGAAS